MCSHSDSGLSRPEKTIHRKTKRIFFFSCPCYKNEKEPSTFYSQEKSQIYQSTFVGQSFICENTSFYRETDIPSGISLHKSNKLSSNSMLPGVLPTNGGKTATSSISTQLSQYAHSQGFGISYYNRLYVPYNQNQTCETTAGPATAGAALHRSMVNEYQQPLQHQVYQPSSAIHKQATNMCTLHQPMDPLPLPFSNRGLLKGLPASEVPTNNFLMQDFTRSNALLSCGEKNCLKKCDGLIDIDGRVVVDAVHCFASAKDVKDTVTLQITNLDYSLDESSLRNFLLNQLKPITPVVSIVFEGCAYAKVTVPDLYVSLILFSIFEPILTVTI